MINLKSEKGAITVFVLVSCMFFIALVVCVQVYMKSQQISVDREYRQIKSSYEGNSLDTNVLSKNYAKLSSLKNLQINIVKTEVVNNVLNVQFNLELNDIEVKSIKYGWGTSSLVDTVSKWVFIENSGTKANMLAVKADVKEQGDYHLFVQVNNEIIYKKITI